jgi:hypothetical protein
MSSSLPVVIQRFPQLRDRVARLFEHDETFQELCEELTECLAAIARLESADKGPEPLCYEYRALCQRLDAELWRRLREAEATG